TLLAASVSDLLVQASEYDGPQPNGVGRKDYSELHRAWDRQGTSTQGFHRVRAGFQFRPEPESTFDLTGRGRSVESTNIYPFLFIFIHMAKAGRQRTTLELVQESSIASQEELQRALSKRGIRVGQATLSRDIHELDLVKTADGYALPSGGTASEAALPSAYRLVREFVLDVRQAQNLVVVKTAV